MVETSDYSPPVFEDKIRGNAAQRDKKGREKSDFRAIGLELNPIQGDYDIEHLAKIHKHLFQDVSTEAGLVRGYGMSKGSSQFAYPSQLPYLFDKELPERIEALNQSVGDKEKYIGAMTDLHSTIDLAHPFREGNGRTTRAFMSQLAIEQGYELDFSTVKQEQWVEACIDSLNSGQEGLKHPLFVRIVKAAEKTFEISLAVEQVEVIKP